MNYRQLGNSGLKISDIGFGCMSLGDQLEENKILIDRAIELGINFFDTADLYQKGENETMLGKILGSRRKNFIIATKVGNQWRKDGSGWDWNPGKEYILSSVEGSLKRLNTDYIDLYQLHGGTIEDNIDETIEAFELLKKQGRIRHYGISSIRPNVIREYVKRSAIVSVMMQYSLLDRRPEETCMPLLKEKNIGVLSRGSLAKGILVNKPAENYLNYQSGEVEKLKKIVAQLSNEKRTPAQTAIKFVLQQSAISSAVVGIRTISQLEEVAGASHAPWLKESEMKTLKEVLQPNRYDQHR
ncbi:MAG: oxidoreductase [Bacteroidetes bacterium]|nr:MAG: oxidoreductase [Bacteroidota bacterium]